MEVTDLVNSKIYVRNNISFMEPNQLIDPFIDILGGNEDDSDISIQVQDEVINQNIGGSTNIAYPRFLIEIKKEIVMFGDVQYQNTYGLIVAMNQQAPVVKIYTGMNVSACTNLCIFNADHMSYQSLNDPLEKIFRTLAEYREGENRKISEYREAHKKLVETYLTQNELNEKIGFMLRYGVRSKLGTTPIVQAAKYLNDPGSLYYAGKAETSLYNLYNAVSQSITNSKDLLYKSDKTLGLTKLLLN